MSKLRYSEEQVRTLQNNPNVKKCSSKSITYGKDFKIRAVKAWLEEGQSPNTIFKRAGLDPAVIGAWRSENCLKLWRKIYQAHGEAGLAAENRGKNGGRKPKDKTSADVEYLQAKVAYLEAENSFLKNLKTKNKT
ncbi:MAG: HTH domain-containing protein [Patescibacteria group bacterium]